MELQIMIGHVLRQRRQALGLSLRDMEELHHYGRGYLSQVERGQKALSMDSIWRLCEALGLPLSVMLAEVSDLLAEIEKGAAYATA